MGYLWVIGAALYIGVVWYLDWRSIGDAVASADLRILVGLMALETAGLWVRALKWRLVLGPRQEAVGLFFLAKAAGNFSPGRVGELAPLVLKKFRTPRVGAWIMLDRLLEIAATLGLGLAGLAALQIPKRGMVVMVCVAFAVLVVAPLYVLTRRRLFLWCAGRVSEGGVFHRVFMLLAAVSEEIVRLGRAVPIASAITFLATCIDICIAVLLYKSFGYEVGFALLAVVSCAHGLVSAIPFTPNATGVPYLVAAALVFEIAGVPKEVLAAAVGVRMVAVNIVFWPSFALGVGRKTTGPRPRNQAALFDQLAAGDMLYRYAPEALDALRALVPPRGRLLDVGCGDGTIGAVLDADHVVGLDISPRCAKLAAARGLPVVIGDAVAGLPFSEGAFDAVCCFDVLHHVGRSWDNVFDQFDAVLRPGCTLIIVEPDAHNPFIRWTQAPDSPIRTAPCDDEPAIDPTDLLAHLTRRGYDHQCMPIHIEGAQVERALFPLWQRLCKAPFVLGLAWWYRRRPNKFALVCQKQKATS